MSQIHESQKLKQQASLQNSVKQLIGPQLHNLNKHISYVFAITLHNVILEESFDKCKEFDDKKEQNQSENEWQKIKKSHWENKKLQQKGEILKEQKCFIVSAGADKNIYLWDFENMQLQGNSQVQIKTENLQEYQNLNIQTNKDNQGNQGNENQNNNLIFTKDELDLHHVIIPYQQNLYDFVTCLCSVKLNQNTSFLIVGYENNQIIRYNISGEYWTKGVGQLKYKLNKDKITKLQPLNETEITKLQPLNETEITKQLQPHNDAVRSIVYFNDQLCSCGDDMQLLIQNIDGIIMKRFYFDSIIENLYIWNGHLIFPHYTVDLKAISKEVEKDLLKTRNNLQQEIIQQSKNNLQQEMLQQSKNNLLQGEQIQQNNNINQQELGANQQKRQKVEEHSYSYGLQQYIMIMGKDQQNNFDIKLDNLKYYDKLEEAYEQIDKITCFELTNNQNILYSTQSGKLIKIIDPLKNNQIVATISDKYKDKDNKNLEYKYQILNCNQIQTYEINKIIMSFIKYESMLYLFCKNQYKKEEVFLYKVREINNQQNQSYDVEDNHILTIKYLEQQVKNQDDKKDGKKDDKKDGKKDDKKDSKKDDKKDSKKDDKKDDKKDEKVSPYEVFLQNPMLVKEGNTKIILLCGDQLRYYLL